MVVGETTGWPSRHLRPVGRPSHWDVAAREDPAGAGTDPSDDGSVLNILSVRVFSHPHRAPTQLTVHLVRQ